MLTAKNSTALEDRLLRARQKYQKERDAVIDAASQRRGVIRETVADLNAEEQSLAKVEDAARNS